MSRPARGLSAGILVPAVLLVASGRAFAGGLEAPNVQRQLGPYVRAQVLRAAERLGQQACSLVLSDYADPRTGRPLADSLPAGTSAGVYLSSLTYLPGPADGPCRTTLITAYTRPGAAVVWICKGRFDRWGAGRDRDAPVMILIHEALHTLGLGENPPTSFEITERVESRCGH